MEAPPLPKTSSTENGLPKLSSPINPKLRKALLEYFKVKYLGTSKWSNIEESSSPAIISSSSRVLPAPDIETQPVDDLMNIVQQNSGLLLTSPNTSDVLIPPNAFTEASIQLGNKVTLNTAPMVLSVYERTIPNAIPLPSITTLPINSIENLATTSYSPNLNSPPDSKNYFGGYPTSNPLYNVPHPLRYNRISLPDVITPSDLMSSINNAENFRSGSPNTFKIINNYSNAYPCTSIQGRYALNLAPQLSTLNTENSNSVLTQRVPKVPLLVPSSPNKYLERQYYNYINQHKYGRKVAPMYYQDYLNTLAPLPYLRNCDVSYLSSGFNLASPHYPAMTSYGMLRALPEPIIPKANQFGFKMSDYATSPLPTNELNANIDNMNNDCPDDTQPTIDIIIDTTIHCDIPDNLENLITGKLSNLDLSELSKNSSKTIQVKPHENSLNISSLVSPIDLSFSNIKKNIETPVLCDTESDVHSLTTTNYPPKIHQSVFPATYINTSPTYALSQTSANAVSALNDVVSSITRNILNTFVSCLTTQSRASNTVCPISYSTPSLGVYNRNLMKPCMPQYVHTSTLLPFNTYPTNTFLPSQPIVYDDIPSATTNTYLKDVTVSTSGSSQPTKISLLPPTSFSDYLPSRPCPSTLPLPILPSYTDISPSFIPVPQVFDANPLDRRSKTVERLLDLAFLAELLHGERYIE